MHEMGVIHPLTVVGELNEISFGRLKRVEPAASRMSCKVDVWRLCGGERPFWNGDVHSLGGRVWVLETVRARTAVAL